MITLYNDNLNLRNDKSEKVRYDITGFPAFLRKTYMPPNMNLTSASHWHDDVELIYVYSGSLRFNVNGDIITMHEGEGIFINSRQLHVTTSDGSNAGEMYCVLLHPMLLCSSQYVERKYVTPVINNEGLPYIVLKDSIQWQADILYDISRIYECSEEEAGELKLLQLFYDLWEKLYTNMGVGEAIPPERNHNLTALKDMIAYIHRSYNGKITLSDISKAGNVGITTCSAIFKKYINRTPIGFLTDHRLQKAIELLLSTDMTITEICYETGFAGASYFSEVFRKNFGCSPSEYRRTSRDGDGMKSHITRTGTQ